MSDHIPSTQAEIGGFVWTIYADATEETINHIERVCKSLQRRGYSAPKRAAWTGGAGRLSKPLAKPAYNDDGDPCCPIHKNRNGQPTKIRYIGSKDGRPGFWGCPAKGDGSPGETLNAREYCDLRFDLPPPPEKPSNGVRNEWEAIDRP